MEKTVVQVNGKSYDAVTGRRITDIIAPVKQQLQHAQKPETVVRVKQQRTRTQTARPAASHAKRHTPQTAKTLMRRAVTKPKAGLKKQLHVQHEVAHTSEHAIAVKHTALHLDTARARRAKQIEKDQQVHRFHSPTPVPVTLFRSPSKQRPKMLQYKRPQLHHRQQPAHQRICSSRP